MKKKIWMRLLQVSMMTGLVMYIEWLHYKPWMQGDLVENHGMKVLDL